MRLNRIKKKFWEYHKYLLIKATRANPFYNTRRSYVLNPTQFSNLQFHQRKHNTRTRMHVLKVFTTPSGIITLLMLPTLTIITPLRSSTINLVLITEQGPLIMQVLS